jgi:putative copper export protein
VQDGVVIPMTWESVRVSVHVLAATVWLGGQIVLAALVPALRGYGRDVVRAAARRFNLFAWPAFGVLVATGVGNVIATGLGGGAYRTTLIVKIVLVAVSGLAAFLHQRARTPAALAGFGALSLLAAIGAAVLGVVLGG